MGELKVKIPAFFKIHNSGMIHLDGEIEEKALEINKEFDGFNSLVFNEVNERFRDIQNASNQNRLTMKDQALKDIDKAIATVHTEKLEDETDLQDERIFFVKKILFRLNSDT